MIKKKPNPVPARSVAVTRRGVVTNFILRRIGDPLQAGEIETDRAEIGDTVSNGAVVSAGPKYSGRTNKRNLIAGLRSAGEWGAVRSALASAPASVREEWDAVFELDEDDSIIAWLLRNGATRGGLARAFKKAAK